MTRDQFANERATKVKARVDDIPLELAVRAYSGISFTPERRAEIVREEYVSHMQGIANELSKLVTNDEQRVLLVQELEWYRQRYIELLAGYLEAKSRVVSPMIAGPSNFPVAKNEKALRSEQKRLDELVSWSERAKETIRRKLLDARSEEEVEAEKRQRLLKEVRLNIETIKRIDAGEYVGGRDLFKSSIEGFIRRAADRGDINAAREALRVVAEAQKGMRRPIFTQRHSIWRYVDEAEARLQKRKELAEATPKRIIIEYKGATVIDNLEADRVQIIFDDIPSQEIRSALKRQGWRWSPKAGAWQRKRTTDSVQSARHILSTYYDEDASTWGPASPEAVDWTEFDEV